MMQFSLLKKNLFQMSTIQENLVKLFRFKSIVFLIIYQVDFYKKVKLIMHHLIRNIQ
jgi:hypothetical protein